MSRPFVICPMGGLGNRLRVILSQRALHDSVEVLWARSTGVCRATWADVFEPLDRVTFRDIGEMPAQDYAGPCDQGPCSSANPDAPTGWALAYRELRPRHRVLERVHFMQERFAPYAAVHVRHSDHDENAARFGHVTTNDELLEWYRTGNDYLPLFLASECKQTQQWFRDRLPGVYTSVAWGTQVHNYDERPGTLEDAVVDMWMCRDATLFAGTWISSFSETVDLLRNPPDVFDPIVHMPSTTAEWFRGRPDRAEAWIAQRMK